jgi:arginine exporter protein ArgO
MYAKQTIRERILKNKGLLNRLWILFVTSFTTTWILTGRVYAAAVSPADEINLIVERVISIMTQVGSAVLLLFIVKDAFTLLERKDDPMVRTTLLRDIFLLVVAAIFLFNPNLILDAIRFIANV